MSSLSGLTLILPYAAFSLFGLFELKRSTPGLNAGFALGFAAYAASFLIWVRILKLVPLSVAFPLATGVVVVGTQLVGRFRFGEPLTGGRVVGVALILGGIVLLRPAGAAP